AVRERSTIAIELEVSSTQRIQRLERVITDAEIEEVFFDELSDAGRVRIIRLLVEHGAAVAREAAGSTVLGLGEEQPGTSPLARGQRIVSGEELVEGSVTRDRRPQERRRSAQHGLVVDELIELFLTDCLRVVLLALCVSLRLVRERLFEELDEG